MGGGESYESSPDLGCSPFISKQLSGFETMKKQMSCLSNKGSPEGEGGGARELGASCGHSKLSHSFTPSSCDLGIFGADIRVRLCVCFMQSFFIYSILPCSTLTCNHM